MGQQHPIGLKCQILAELFRPNLPNFDKCYQTKREMVVVNTPSNVNAKTFLMPRLLNCTNLSLIEVFLGIEENHLQWKTHQRFRKC